MKDGINRMRHEKANRSWRVIKVLHKYKWSSIHLCEQTRISYIDPVGTEVIRTEKREEKGWLVQPEAQRVNSVSTQWGKMAINSAEFMHGIDLIFHSWAWGFLPPHWLLLHESFCLPMGRKRKRRKAPGSWINIRQVFKTPLSWTQKNNVSADE